MILTGDAALACDEKGGVCDMDPRLGNRVCKKCGYIIWGKR